MGISVGVIMIKLLQLIDCAIYLMYRYFSVDWNILHKSGSGIENVS